MARPSHLGSVVPTNTAPLRRRQEKPTVRIVVRTVSECEGLLVAYTAASNFGLPTPNCDR